MTFLARSSLRLLLHLPVRQMDTMLCKHNSHRLCRLWAAASGGSHYDCRKAYTCDFLLHCCLHLSPTAAVNDQHLNVQYECVVWSCFSFPSSESI